MNRIAWKDIAMCMNKTWFLFGLFIALLLFTGVPSKAAAAAEGGGHGHQSLPPIADMVRNFSKSTGLYSYIVPSSGDWTDGIGPMIMVAVAR